MRRSPHPPHRSISNHISHLRAEIIQLQRTIQDNLAALYPKEDRLIARLFNEKLDDPALTQLKLLNIINFSRGTFSKFHEKNLHYLRKHSITQTLYFLVDSDKDFEVRMLTFSYSLFLFTEELLKKLSALNHFFCFVFTDYVEYTLPDAVSRVLDEDQKKLIRYLKKIHEAQAILEQQTDLSQRYLLELITELKEDRQQLGEIASIGPEPLQKILLCTCPPANIQSAFDFFERTFTNLLQGSKKNHLLYIGAFAEIKKNILLLLNGFDLSLHLPTNSDAIEILISDLETLLQQHIPQRFPRPRIVAFEIAANLDAETLRSSNREEIIAYVNAKINEPHELLRKNQDLSLRPLYEHAVTLTKNEPTSHRFSYDATGYRKGMLILQFIYNALQYQHLCVAEQMKVLAELTVQYQQKTVLGRALDQPITITDHRSNFFLFRLTEPPSSRHYKKWIAAVEKKKIECSLTPSI